MLSNLSKLPLCLVTFAALATACDPGASEPLGRDPSSRGQSAGKADGSGSCEDACGGQSASGSCYCDDQCANYGDCCDDYEPVCLPDDDDEGGATTGEACDLVEGCGQGAWCRWSGEGAGGVCESTDVLVDIAHDLLRKDFGLPVDSNSPTVVSRAIHVVGGTAAVGSSEYAVEVDAGKERVARVRFDLSGNPGETWRVIPQDIRNSAPWGNAEYLTPGDVMMTMEGDTTLERIHSLFVGPVLDHLSMEDVDRSSDGSMWFFTLKVPAFTELETIAKVQDQDDVIEAWPNRIVFVQLFEDGAGVQEVIAEL